MKKNKDEEKKEYLKGYAFEVGDAYLEYLKYLGEMMQWANECGLNDIELGDVYIKNGWFIAETRGNRMPRMIENIGKKKIKGLTPEKKKKKKDEKADNI